MKWLVNTDTNLCRIYQYTTQPRELKLLNEIKHPENKERNQDLVTDRPGHYSTNTTTRGSYSPETEPKEIQIDKFAKEIADILENGRVHQLYNQLIIIALPHMNGLLHQHFNKHVQELVIHKITKDFIHVTDRELLDILKENYI